MSVKWRRGFCITTDKEEATHAVISRCPEVLPDVFEGAPLLKKVSILRSDSVADISVLLKYSTTELVMLEGCRDVYTLIQMTELISLNVGTFDARALSHLTSLKSLYINYLCPVKVLYHLPETLKTLTLHKGIEREIDVT
jgi:hypothetical protein